jgi:hypothetical protein
LTYSIEDTIFSWQIQPMKGCKLVGYKIDITGQQFTYLTVVRFDDRPSKVPRWICRCICGTEKSIWVADLKRGGAKSCGCMTGAMKSASLTKHGMSFHPAYRAWIELRSRCHNKNKDGYDLYGGRGIEACDRWSEFDKFWEDMGPTWVGGLSIDRIDVNGDYTPGNCKWSTPKEQANNRRNNRMINTPRGRMQVGKASVIFGVNIKTLQARIAYGWTDPAEMIKPARPTSRVYKRTQP